MADPAYQPTLTWDGDSQVWDDRTLAWDQFVPPPDTLGETLMVLAERGRDLMVSEERGRHLMVKRGHRRT